MRVSICVLSAEGRAKRKQERRVAASTEPQRIDDCGGVWVARTHAAPNCTHTARPSGVLSNALSTARHARLWFEGLRGSSTSVGRRPRPMLTRPPASATSEACGD